MAGQGISQSIICTASSTILCLIVFVAIGARIDFGSRGDVIPNALAGDKRQASLQRQGVGKLEKEASPILAATNVVEEYESAWPSAHPTWQPRGKWAAKWATVEAINQRMNKRTYPQGGLWSDGWYEIDDALGEIRVGVGNIACHSEDAWLGYIGGSLGFKLVEAMVEVIADGNQARRFRSVQARLWLAYPPGDEGISEEAVTGMTKWWKRGGEEVGRGVKEATNVGMACKDMVITAWDGGWIKGEEGVEGWWSFEEGWRAGDVGGIGGSERHTARGEAREVSDLGDWKLACEGSELKVVAMVDAEGLGVVEGTVGVGWGCGWG
ncbi:hypothetical protein CYMTET_49417 [Cymbomonas tetramitiformis]|uniref:Uncharacterized protein n=1 Tax=Cymbomonas tetramitiformis TaxID=36881 RepID=A0AAE0BQ94_9CHLO|nr:hypothetical protein CYMTET_49417 [Cymbomonas tetramitiformis]